MPTYKITSPDGTVYRVTGDGTEQEALAQLQAQLATEKPAEPTSLAQDAGNLLAGAARGAGSIGATLLSPLDAAARALNEGQPWNVGGYDILGQDRRKGMDEGLASLGANAESWPYAIGKFGAEVAGTAGAGGVLGQGAARVGLPGLAAALESGGLAGTSLANRVAGGALAGAAQGGLIDPSLEGAGVGAVTGGALGGLASAGSKVFGSLAPARRRLALDAEQAGITVPVDRILDNRLLDRFAGGLEYAPLSGRGSVLRNMEEQVRVAANRTMGQQGADVRESVANARRALGPEFDRVTAAADIADSQAFRDALTDQADRIVRVVPSSEAKPLLAQIRFIEDHLDTGGYFPGDAALTMKTELDDMAGAPGATGKRARELRRVLLDEIEAKLQPAEAAAYRDMRRKWVNMLRMEKLQTHDAEGAVSMARMGNMPHKNATGELNRLADVAYTFAKARDAPHSLNQQNILMGLGATGAGLAGFVPQVLGGLAGGRAANMALNSDWLRRLVLGQAQQGVLGPAILGLREGAYRFAPGAAVAGSRD
jgi:hypothetical protein